MLLLTLKLRMVNTSMQSAALFYLFTTVCIGYAAFRMKLLPDAATAALPALLTNLCYPAMILSTFRDLSIKELLSSGLTVVIITFLVTLALYFIGKVLFRNYERPQRLLLQYILGIGNVTYVGIPLISIFFGAEGVSYAILHGVVQDVLIWMLYYPSFLGKSEQMDKRRLASPCLIALMIGLIITVTQWEPPVFLNQTIDRLSSAASPIALIFLGITIAKYGVFRWIKSTPAIMISIIKVVCLPLLLFCVLSLVTDRYNTILLCILFACPAPIMSIVWAWQYEGDVELSINSCICSTQLYLLFIGVTLILLSLIGWI